MSDTAPFVDQEYPVIDTDTDKHHPSNSYNMTRGFELDRSLSDEIVVLKSDAPFDVSTYEGWAQQGELFKSRLRDTERTASQLYWEIGHWLIHGENLFPDQWSQMADEFGFSQATVKNMMWVASKIPPAEINGKVSWFHHQAVASLEKGQRDEVLREAIEDDLSVQDTRLLARAVKNEKQDEEYDKHMARFEPPLDNTPAAPIFDLDHIEAWSRRMIGEEWTEEKHLNLMNFLGLT